MCNNSKNCKFTTTAWMLMQWYIFQGSCILPEHHFNKLTTPRKNNKRKKSCHLGHCNSWFPQSLTSQALTIGKGLNFNVTNSEMTQEKNFLSPELRGQSSSVSALLMNQKFGIDTVQFFPKNILFNFFCDFSRNIYSLCILFFFLLFL